MPLPFTVGYDFSGTIDEVDEADSSKYPSGTNVFGVQWGQGKHDEDDKPCGGTFAEYVAVPTSRLSIKPDGLPVPVPTSFFALLELRCPFLIVLLVPSIPVLPCLFDLVMVSYAHIVVVYVETTKVP